jgi:hypothetical protein
MTEVVNEWLAEHALAVASPPPTDSSPLPHNDHARANPAPEPPS